MRYEPVTLSPADRVLVCMTMGQKLIEYGVELIELSVSARHFHAVCRFPLELPPRPDGAPRPAPANLLKDGRDPIGRHILGRAKRGASIALLRANRKAQDQPLWAKRTKLEPVKDRAHQLAVVSYIRRHEEQDAALWTRLR